MASKQNDVTEVRLNALDREQLSEQERLCQHLKEAREFLGLSQEFVADHIDLSRVAISAIETNKRKVSSVELKKFARLYHLDLSFFFGDEVSTAQIPQDRTVDVLFRTAKALSAEDKEQVLRFAQFLRHAKTPPSNTNEPVDK